MVKSKGGLGRGLGALLPDFDEPTNSIENDGQAIAQLPLEKIMVNPDQPRKHFDEDQMADLIDSVKEHGILQPIIVAPRDNNYIIVAGERRYRAAKEVGLTILPAIIKELDDEQIFELALIENVQRANLNPIEEARGYKRLIDHFGYSAELLAKRMGKSRPQISNTLRLLSLPDEVLAFVEDERLSVGHVRPLIALNDTQWQIEFAHEIFQNDLSVREVEAMISNIREQGGKISTEQMLFQAEKPKMTISHDLLSLQEQLKNRLQTKVKIKQSETKGKIEIEFYGDDDLKRVIDALGGEFY